MTWWEAEEMAAYITKTEIALDEWSMSNPEMKHEQYTINQIATKINQTLEQSTDPNKKDFLINLASRIEGLRLHLAERLKRDIPDSRTGGE